MPPDKWGELFQILQWLTTLVAGVVMWVWDRKLKAEREALDGRFTRIVEWQTAQELKIERINEQLSNKLVPAIQALMSRLDRLPEDLRDKYLALDRATDLLAESRRDRAEIWKELERRGTRR